MKIRALEVVEELRTKRADKQVTLESQDPVCICEKNGDWIY